MPTNDWILVPFDLAIPNPVIAERYARDEGIARLYLDGTVDAIDGEAYSLSPGFPSYDDLDRWIERQSRRNNP
jgi:hypothetical protein